LLKDIYGSYSELKLSNETWKEITRKIQQSGYNKSIKQCQDRLAD